MRFNQNKMTINNTRQIRKKVNEAPAITPGGTSGSGVALGVDVNVAVGDGVTVGLGVNVGEGVRVVVEEAAGIAGIESQINWIV